MNKDKPSKPATDMFIENLLAISGYERNWSVAGACWVVTRITDSANSFIIGCGRSEAEWADSIKWYEGGKL